MRFNYQARTKEGEIQTGVVEAGSYEAAVKTLQRHDLAVVFLEPISEVPFYARSLQFLRRIRTKDLVMLYRQLSILFEANIPPLDALASLSRQIRNPRLKDILFEIENDVRAGESISNAMAKHKKTFSSFYVNVIRSGEITGRLDEVLKYLADHAEREFILTSKIRGAFIYPGFILSAFLIVTVVMLIYVIPRLTAVLTETGGGLPLTTRILVGASDFIRSWILVLIPIFIGLGIGFSRFIKTPRGREAWDKFKLKAPLFGKLLQKMYLARFSENFGTLLKGGISILDALQISAQVVGNRVFSRIIIEAKNEVKTGGEISSVFEKEPKNIPPTVVQMIKVGEKTAKLDEMLGRLASFYQGEVDRTVNNLTQLIEPFLIIVLGACVAFLVASILLPIYNITSSGGF